MSEIPSYSHQPAPNQVGSSDTRLSPPLFCLQLGVDRGETALVVTRSRAIIDARNRGAFDSRSNAAYRSRAVERPSISCHPLCCFSVAANITAIPRYGILGTRLSGTPKPLSLSLFQASDGTLHDSCLARAGPKAPSSRATALRVAAVRRYITRTARAKAVRSSTVIDRRTFCRAYRGDQAWNFARNLVTCGLHRWIGGRRIRSA